MHGDHLGRRLQFNSACVRDRGQVTLEAAVQDRRLGSPQLENRMIDACGVKSGHDMLDRQDPHVTRAQAGPHLTSYHVIEVCGNLGRPPEVHAPEAHTTRFGRPHRQCCVLSRMNTHALERMLTGKSTLSGGRLLEEYSGSRCGCHRPSS